MYCCGENLLFLGPEYSVHLHLFLRKLLRDREREREREREKGEKGEKGGGQRYSVEPASIYHRYIHVHERES